MIIIVNIMIIMIVLVNIIIMMIVLVNIMINIDRASSMLLTTMMLMLTTAQDHHRCCRRHSHHLDVDHRSHDLLSTLSLWKFIYKQLCHYGILYINIYVYLYNSSWMTSRLGRNMTPGCCYLNSLKSISNHHHLHWKVKENDIEDMWHAKTLFEPISAEYYPSITRVLGVLPKYCLSIQSITQILPEYSVRQWGTRYQKNIRVHITYRRTM